MPEKKTVERAKQDLKEGKSASTAAGEFVHEEIEHIREGKHGARSAKQAIAIGLSKARRAGVPLAPPKAGQASQRTRRSAQRDTEVGEGTRTPRRPSAKRRRATTKALKSQPRAAASKTALSRQAKSAARRRKKATSAAAPRARRSAQTKTPSSGRKRPQSATARGSRARSPAPTA
jgi:hypothetical protein